MNRESWAESKSKHNFYIHEDDPIEPNQCPSVDQMIEEEDLYYSVREHQSNRDQFWRDCLSSKLRNGCSPSYSSDVADKCLEEYDKRFNPQTGTKVVKKGD